MRTLSSDASLTSRVGEKGPLVCGEGFRPLFPSVHLDSGLDSVLKDIPGPVRTNSWNILSESAFYRNIDRIIVSGGVFLHITEGLEKGVPGSAQDPTLGLFGPS